VLPISLLRVRFSGGRVAPRYLGHDYLDLAREVLRIFRESVGLRLRELNLKLRSLEGEDPRVVRGMAHVLRGNLELEEVDTDFVSRIRLELFREASRNHPVVDEARASILERVSRRFNITPSELENLMLKIYEDERMIVGFRDMAPEELLRRYNLSLAQTLLFRALDVVADLDMTGAQARDILRRVKLLGLMYMAEDLGNGVRLIIDGPISILKQTDRYGTRLAKLLPIIIRARGWRIRARVKLGRRVYEYIESHETSKLLAHDYDIDYSFDSVMELDLYRRLVSICSNVVREPEPLVVEGRLFIPDFKVGDLYLELVGFWTPQYLERKYEKLLKLRRPIVVMVNEKLATATWRELPHFVVLYKDRPRITDIYKLIKPHCRPRSS